MKFYVKPSMSVIELQLKENIAAVPTTVYKASSRTSVSDSAKSIQMALSDEGTGFIAGNIGGVDIYNAS